MENHAHKSMKKQRFGARSSRIIKGNRPVECVDGVDGDLAHRLREVGVVSEKHLKRYLENHNREEFCRWLTDTVGATHRQVGILHKSLNSTEFRKENRNARLKAMIKRKQF